MTIPTHGPSCVTQSFPIDCPTCGVKVFFLKCNHGSKVFFDSVGSPWPIHLCFDNGELQSLINDLTDINGNYHDEIADRIQQYIHQTGEHISDDTIRRIQERLGKARQLFRIIQVQPNNEIHAVTGIVMNVDRNINLYRRFNLDKNDISKQLLGGLANESFAAITIREYVRELNIAKDYVVLVSSVLINHLHIKKNTEVVVSFEFRNILHRANIWIVNFLELVDR